jgi:hypothetical protein
VEVLDCFFTNPNWNNSWKGVNVDLKADKVWPQIVRAYLSTQHFDLGQIDRLFGTPATTRSWKTIISVLRILKSHEPGK